MTKTLNCMKRFYLPPLLFALSSHVQAQHVAQPDSLSSAPPPPEEVQLGETAITTKRKGIVRSFSHTDNQQTISLHELSRAACCNLGESFVTNPSVDVNYNDAATGARQIRLLGLAGTYVQMMHENTPSFRIAAQPYGLNYTPGTWMQSIQVSKGASSVKNGPEAITGQINVEYKKPHTPYPNWLLVNGYADARGRYEGNVESTLRINPQVGTTILGHYSKTTRAHDDNHDGLADMPRTEQLNLLNRWTLNFGKVFSQVLVRGLSETRRGGQIVSAPPPTTRPYLIDIDTKRIEGFAKSAYIVDDAYKTNVALILSGSMHDQQSIFGQRRYDLTQNNAYASLIYEATYSPQHHLSAGLSFNHDNFNRQLPHLGLHIVQNRPRQDENVGGVYTQYTYTPSDHLTLMAGLRADKSSLFGTFLTPRAHLKWTPSRAIALRLSAGKGYRSTHVLEENNYLLAGARQLHMESNVLREAAWNYGATAQLRFPVASRVLNASLEYFFTDFQQQAVRDFDSSPSLVRFYQLQGRSFSSVIQAEASYPFFDGFNLTAAYRFVHARTDYELPTGRQRLETPLQSRYKALLTATYATPLERWQFDLTLQVNGGGRLPQSYTTDEGKQAWPTAFKAYPQLSAQITRNFRRLSLYVGGENLTSYQQPNAIINAHQPWSDRFDPTMVYGPLDGAMLYAGFRYTLAR